ncbi:MAG TPA: substrate-binding domain-containing protein [Verrucomicrobiae bacterium]|jgi:LacI family transcriptional regulator
MKLPQRLSLVAQTAVVLREQIVRGVWPRFLPGEGEFCAKLHVSRVTLRAALAILQREGLIRSSQGKRREVVKRRRRLLAASNHRVVLVMPSPLHTLSPNAVFWVGALREYLAEAGHHLDVQVNRTAYGYGQGNILKSMMEQERASGWVIYRSTEPMQRWFSERKLPCVITGSRYPGVEMPSVDIAYRAVCRHAVGRFLVHGHRQLVLLNPASGAAGDIESEQGFHEAVNNSGRSEVRAEVVRHNGTVNGLTYKLDALLRRPQPPTGFFVSRPEHVLTVASQLLRHGRRLPQDVALISRDDAPFLEHFVPSIARYVFDPKVFARRISKAVLDMADGASVKPVDHQILPRFSSGQTLG